MVKMRQLQNEIQDHYIVLNFILRSPRIMDLSRKKRALAPECNTKFTEPKEVPKQQVLAAPQGQPPAALLVLDQLHFCNSL